MTPGICKLCFAKEGDLISLLGPDGEPCSDVWEVCAENQPGRKPAPEGASNGLYSDERDFYLSRELKRMFVRAPMPHLSTRVAIIKRRDEMKKLMKLGDLKRNARFEIKGRSFIVHTVGNIWASVWANDVGGALVQVDNLTEVWVDMNEPERDLTLLRPLDPEQLSAGDKVVHFNGVSEITYLSGPDPAGYIAAVCYERLRIRLAERYRMKPLGWIEGRPVYRGDKLFHEGKEVQALKHFDNVGWMTCADGYHRDTKKMTWDKPKVKKEGWLNIYETAPRSFLYDTKEAADRDGKLTRKACVHVEWEE